MKKTIEAVRQLVKGRRAEPAPQPQSQPQPAVPPNPPLDYPVDQDDFMNWMRFINPGMLNKRNVRLMAYCIERLPSDAAVVEIGSFGGLSLNHMIHLLRRYGRSNPLFSADDWSFETSPQGMIAGSAVSFDAYRAHVKDTFRRNVMLFSGDRLPHHIELSSDAFFAAWERNEQRSDYFGRPARLGGPIALAYIDGDHAYEQSKKDFENVDRYLEVGGFVIFDDSDPANEFGCARTAQEAAGLARYEVIATNNHCLRKIAV